jgi:DNA-directed RNA polymerase subunit RPC12/RpoP
MQIKDIKTNTVIVNEDMEVKGNLEVVGDLKVGGDIIVSGTLTTVHHETIVKEDIKQKKVLICTKCGGNKFTPTGRGIQLTVYIENGSAGGSNEYRCSKCGNTEWVSYPPTYNKVEPREIELPEDK